MKTQVACISKRAFSLVYRLNFFRRSTNFNLRMHLIETLLCPIMDYCSVVWCDISAELNGKFQVIMNAGVRYVYGVRRSEHISPYRKDLGWLTVEKRREYFMVSLLHRFFSSLRPAYLVERYQPYSSERPTRGHMPPLRIPPFKSEFLENSFLVKSSYLWNALPPTIRNCTSIPSFKRSAYAYFLSLGSERTPLFKAHL